MRKWDRIIYLFALTLLLQAGCASARRDEPLVGPLPITDAALERGEKLFMKKCNQCHPKGDAGLGPALNNKPLPGFMIKLQVRMGAGAMPSFSKEEISKSELEELVSYLKALRRHG
jgi:mono/diheme cytochrome c family protein